MELGLRRILGGWICLFLILFVCQACGGGGGGGGPDDNPIGDNTDKDKDDDADGAAGTTRFSGGTLDDLKALNAGLVFDHLEISGKLQLTRGSTATITANSLTITDSGGIGYQYSTCDYFDAPEITLKVADALVIQGDIMLNGRSGTRVSSGATCNSCYGQDGGDVTITAGSLAISASIQNHGGSGSTSVTAGAGSSGCSAGNGGAIQLTAATMDLSGAEIETYGGRGGRGTSFGSPSNGRNGDPGTVTLAAEERITMAGGDVACDGRLKLTAGETDIAGRIQGNPLVASVAGAEDTTGPDLQITYPTAGTQISIDESLELKIRVSDSGTGVREVQVTGFGYDAVHSGSEIQDGVLTVLIETPSAPASLQVSAVDNQGNSAIDAVSNIAMTGDLSVAAGDSLILSDDLQLGAASRVNIAGTLVIARGSAPTLAAGSLEIATGGLVTAAVRNINDEDSSMPTLTLDMAGAVVIDGDIDLSGTAALGNSGEDGESAGEIIIKGSSIQINGSVRADGKNGGIHVRGVWGTIPSHAGTGGDGGQITLESDSRIDINGVVSAMGGTAEKFSGCGPAGGGGTIQLSYASTADATGGEIRFDGGRVEGCTFADFGESGSVWVDYTGTSQDAEALLVTLDEIEPNGSHTNNEVQPLFIQAKVNGHITSDDTADLVTGADALEDLYRFSVSDTTQVNIDLTTDKAIDLDLYVNRYDDLGLVVMSIGSTGNERIESLSLDPGVYLIGVNRVGESSVAETDYTLTISP